MGHLWDNSTASTDTEHCLNAKDHDALLAYSIWTFEPCKGPVFYPQQTCCSSEVESILTCELTGYTELGNDWQGGYLEIQGHKFCDVFYTRAMIKLNRKDLNKSKMDARSFILLSMRTIRL